MALQALSNAYGKIEEKWFNMLDFLESKGVPVYIYADFFENKGIPSLPVTAGIILMLVVIISSLAVAGTTADTSFTLSLKDDIGEGLKSVSLRFENEAGEHIRTFPASNGDKITLEGIRLGQSVKVIAKKENYGEVIKTITLNAKEMDLALNLVRNFNIISASVLLQDNETGTAIDNALVSFEVRGKNYPAKPQEDQSFLLAGIPENVDGTISIQADGYETYNETTGFTENEMKPILMQPSIADFSGTTTLIVTAFDSETNAVMKDVNMKIVETGTDDVLFEGTAKDGTIQEGVDAGKVIHVVIEKKGYRLYESEQITLRGEDFPLTAYLEKGGSNLIVTVKDEGNKSLGSVKVKIIDAENNLLLEEDTGFSGAAAFQGLNLEEDLSVTAFKEGFIPARKNIKEYNQTELVLTLTKATTINSANLEMTVINSRNQKTGDAAVTFFETIDGKELSLGMPAVKTDAFGFAEAMLPLGKEITVKAAKDLENGSKTATLSRGEDNKLTVKMELPANVILLELFEDQEQPAKGDVRIITVTGEELFSEFVEDGVIFFDSKGNKEAIVFVELDANRTIQEKILLTSSKLTLDVSAKAVELKPEITFEGILDEENNEVTEVSRNRFYWLKFRVHFPKNNMKAGVHVRLGGDEKANADELDYGIAGFETNTARFFAGKSYTTSPTPVNEANDKRNKAVGSEPAKWIELYFDKPNDTEIVKVKVIVREGSAEKKMDVHYRAFVESEAAIYRDPEDSELSTSRYTMKKQALYAAAKNESVSIAEEKPECTETFCFDLSFAEESGAMIREEEFRPAIENIYAMELRINASEDLKSTIIFETDQEDPELYFGEIQVDSFASFPKTTGKEVIKKLEGIAVQKGIEKKIRVFFKGLKEDNSFIKVTVKAGEQTEEKTAHFIFSKDHEMQIEVIPREVRLNQPFTVLLKDSQTNEFVTNARIKIINSKKGTTRTLTGDNSREKGLNGEYRFKGGLDLGQYVVQAEAEGFAPVETSVIILGENILRITPERTEITIRKGAKEEQKKLKIQNISPFTLTGMGFEVVEVSGSTQDYSFKVDMPETLTPGQTTNVTLRAVYEGDPEKTSYTNIDLIINARIEDDQSSRKEVSRHLIQEKSSIQLTYNKPLDQKCLELDKEKLMLDLISEPNSEESTTVSIKNSCNETISLTPEFESKDNDAQLELKGDKVTLKPGEQKQVKIIATNKIHRAFYTPVTRNYTVAFTSPLITRSIPVQIILRNILFSLHTNNNITIFIAPTEKKDGVGFAPLNVRNTGFKAIDGLSFTVAPPAGIQLTVLPNEAGQYSGVQTTGLQQTGSTIYNQALYENPLLANLSAQKQTSYQAYGEPGILPDSSTLPYNPYFTPRNALDPMGFSMGGMQQSMYSQALLPGQELSPPKTIVATSKNLSELTEKQYYGQVQIFGTINGRRYYFKTVGVTINVSGTECLKVYKDDMLDFQSTSVGYGTISKKLTIENNCAETLKAFKVSPEEISGNKMELSVPATFSLSPGNKASVQLIVNKNSAYITEGFDSIKITARGSINQREFESGTLGITIRLGKEAEITGKTIKVEFQRCESPDPNDLIEVDVPLIAGNKESCTERYCDAVRLSEQLAEMIASQYRIAASTAGQIKFNSVARNCPVNETYCDYHELGVPESRITVYMMNDFISEQLLKKALQKQQKAQEVQKYSVKTRNNVSDITRVFESRRVLLTNNLEGCGAFNISISGSMKNSQGKLIPEEQTIIVRVEKVGQTFAECLPEAQNILMFLPKDEELEDQSMAAAGTVNYSGQELKKTAEGFAESMFDSKKRALRGSRQTNSLALKSKAMKEIIKVEVSKTQVRSELQKPDMTATINESLLKSQEEKVIQNIVKGLKDLTEHSTERDICISKDRDYMLINDFGELLDPITITKEVKIPLKMYEERACSLNELEVKTNYPEKVNLNMKIVDSGDVDRIIPGVTAVSADAQNNKLNEITDDGKTKFELKLTEEKQNKVMEGKFKACIDAADLDALRDNLPTIFASKVKVKAEHASLPLESEYAEAGFQICTQYPDTLAKKLKNLDLKKGYYFIMDTGKGTDKLSAQDFQNIFDNLTEEGTDGRSDQRKKLRTEAYGAGLGTFAVTCTSISLAGNAFMGSLSPWLIVDALFDCGITTGALAASIYSKGAWGKMYTQMKKTAKSVPGIGGALDFLFFPSETGDPAETAEDVQEIIESEDQELIWSTAARSGIHRGIQGAKRSSTMTSDAIGGGLWEKLSTGGVQAGGRGPAGSINNVTQRAANHLTGTTNGLMDNTAGFFRDAAPLPNAVETEIKNSFEKNFKGILEKKVKEGGKRTLVTQDDAVKIYDEALEKTFSDSKVLNAMADNIDKTTAVDLFGQEAADGIFDNIDSKAFEGVSEAVDKGFKNLTAGGAASIDASRRLTRTSREVVNLAQDLANKNMSLLTDMGLVAGITPSTELKNMVAKSYNSTAQIISKVEGITDPARLQILATDLTRDLRAAGLSSKEAGRMAQAIIGKAADKTALRQFAGSDVILAHLKGQIADKAMLDPAVASRFARQSAKADAFKQVLVDGDDSALKQFRSNLASKSDDVGKAVRYSDELGGVFKNKLARGFSRLIGHAAGGMAIGLLASWAGLWAMSNSIDKEIVKSGSNVVTNNAPIWPEFEKFHVYGLWIEEKDGGRQYQFVEIGSRNDTDPATEDFEKVREKYGGINLLYDGTCEVEELTTPAEIQTIFDREIPKELLKAPVTK